MAFTFNGHLQTLTLIHTPNSKNFDFHERKCNSKSNEQKSESVPVKRCENCKKLVDKEPKKYISHVKRCKIYYKYVIETVFGFKCQLCPFEIRTKIKGTFDPR